MVDAQVQSARVYQAPATLRSLRLGASAAATDESLIQQIAAGDRRAMQLLFARHSVRVFRFVLRIAKDRSLADDLVGDIFLDLWRRGYRFDGRSKASTWLLAVARHKTISVLRRRRVHADLEDAADVEDPSSSAEAAAAIEDRKNVLRDCIAKLSANHREIIDLVYYHEKPIDEVAGIVGIPLNTVKTRMHYARKQLAALLAEAGIDRYSL